MALSTNGTSDYLLNTVAPQPDPSFPTSIWGWALARTLPNYSATASLIRISRNGTYGAQFGTYVSYSGYYGFALLGITHYESGVDYQFFQDGPNNIGLRINEPFHWGASFESGTLRKLWLNGNLVGTSTTSAPLPSTMQRTSIGAGYNGGGYDTYFDGLQWGIGGVRAALSPQEWWELARGRDPETLPYSWLFYYPLEGNNPLGWAKRGLQSTTVALDLKVGGGSPTAIETPAVQRGILRDDGPVRRRLYAVPASGTVITAGAGARGGARSAAVAALALSGRAYSFGGGRVQGAANLNQLAAARAAGAGRERASASLTVAGAARAQGAGQDRSTAYVTQSAAAVSRGAATDRAAARLDQSAAARGLAGAANRAAGKLDSIGAAIAQGGSESAASGRLTILAAASALGGGRSRAAAQLVLLGAAAARSAGSVKAAASLVISAGARSLAAGRNQAAWSIGSLIIAGAIAMGGGRNRAAAQLTLSAAANSSGQATAAAAGRIDHNAAASAEGAGRTRAGGRLDQVAAARSAGAGRAGGAGHLIISAAARTMGALAARAAMAALQFIVGKPEIVFRAPAVAAPFSALPAITLSAPLVARPFRAAPAT